MGLEFGVFVIIGFFAQMVDGALGMAFGIIASTSLIAAGTPPPLASAAVHAAEIVTTGVSGTSHVLHKNVDWSLFRRLVIPGVVGGIVGAYILTGLPENILKPIVTIYLAMMAVLIFMRVLARGHRRWKVHVPLLGTSGGFLDAIGGGGWGPIVTSTLLASGDDPRRTIGTVNTAEFIVTISISITFLTQLDLAHYGQVVLGLIVGGALAAPLAGYVIKKLPMRIALVLVASVVSVLTVVNVVNLVA
jgi:uncharacterized membrane protein YfcA